MRLATAAFCLSFASALAASEPTPTAAGTEFESTAREIAKMEDQLATAIGTKDTAFLEKVLAEKYFDVYEGEKQALSKADTIARCQAGLLKFLAPEKERRMSPEKDAVAVEGVAKLIPNRQDDTLPAEQWVHVRRLWTKKDGKWLLTSQVRRLEGDEGKGEVD